MGIPKAKNGSDTHKKDTVYFDRQLMVTSKLISFINN